MARLEDFLYNDHEEKLQEIQDKKRRRKRKRKFLKLIFLCGFMIFIVFYFISDYSKVKSLSVDGSRFYEDEEIFKKAGLSYDTRFILMPSFYISHNLEKDPLIKKVKVEKNMQGNITLKVKEEKIVGYQIKDNKNISLLKSDGTFVKLGVENLDKITQLPLLGEFPKDVYTKLGKSFDQGKKGVSQEVISMISEITLSPTTYDEFMVKLLMQDGNVVYASFNSMSLLNDYKRVLPKLKLEKACLWADMESRTFTSSSQCP